MNAERLHLVAQSIADELAELNVAAVAGNLRDGLRGLANNPADAAAQQQVSDARSQLAPLAAAASNTWPPTDRQILDELWISDIIGETLRERFEEILARNDITPSVALEEVEPIVERLQEVTMHLSELLNGLKAFDISQDELVADEFEVGVAIPRGAVSNKLPQLGEEFLELQQILGPFEELAGEGRPDFEVRAIASSDFSVFLLASPGVVLVIAQAVKVIVDTYETILEIKRGRDGLAKIMPEEKLAEIDAHASEIMAERLTALAEELVANSQLGEGRKNELKMEVKWSLNRIANRIDGGYSIDIRTPEPEDLLVEEDDGESDAAARRASLLAIRDMAATIRRLETSGTRILELPESASDVEPKGETAVDGDTPSPSTA